MEETEEFSAVLRGKLSFLLHGIDDFFLRSSWIASISSRTGVSVSIRIFCRFRPLVDFLAPAFGKGLSFSKVIGAE